MLLVASTQTNIGMVFLAISLIVAVVFALVNLRKSRPEVGSEIELAPNRRPYLSDAELEGRKLDRTLSLGLLGLVIVGVGLPLYWLQEPARQENAIADMQRKFVDRGEAMFATTEKGGYNCAFCHGEKGVGGVTPYTLTDGEGRSSSRCSGRGRRSTPFCCASPATRFVTSSNTDVRTPRCRLGVPRVADPLPSRTSRT